MRIEIEFSTERQADWLPWGYGGYSPSEDGRHASLFWGPFSLRVAWPYEIGPEQNFDEAFNAYRWKWRPFRR